MLEITWWHFIVTIIQLLEVVEYFIVRAYYRISQTSIKINACIDKQLQLKHWCIYNNIIIYNYSEYQLLIYRILINQLVVNSYIIVVCLEPANRCNNIRALKY